MKTLNSTSSRTGEQPMITLTQYGLMAEKHWREFRPKMVTEMEAKGILVHRDIGKGQKCLAWLFFKIKYRILIQK